MLSNCPRADGITPDVDPEELARGELLEETGLVASSMTYLGTMWIAYGFTKQKQHIFLDYRISLAPETDPDPEEHDLALHASFHRRFRTECSSTGQFRTRYTLGAWGLYKVWKEKQEKG